MRIRGKETHCDVDFFAGHRKETKGKGGVWAAERALAFFADKIFDEDGSDGVGEAVGAFFFLLAL